MKRISLFLLAISLPLMSIGCSNNPSTQTNTSIQEQEPSEERIPKDGFNELTNQKVGIGGCQIEIPEYFGDNESEDYLLYYAETGPGCVMLRVECFAYEKSQEDFEKEKDGISEQILDGMTQFQVTEIDKDQRCYKGIFSANDGTELNAEYFMELAYTNGIGYAIMMFQSDKSSYDYSGDYRKIVSSLQPIDNGDNKEQSGNDQNKEYGIEATTASEDVQYNARIARFDIDYDDFLWDGYHYWAFVEIENTGNTNFSVSGESFDVENADNSIVTTDDSIRCEPEVVQPGETGYLYSLLGSKLTGVTDIEGLHLVPHFSIKSSKSECHDYIVSDVSVKQTKEGVVTVGRVTNDTEEDDSYLYIHVFYYDKEGNIIGIEGASISDLLSGHTVSFETTSHDLPIGLTTDQIGYYKVLARKY